MSIGINIVYTGWWWSEAERARTRGCASPPSASALPSHYWTKPCSSPTPCLVPSSPSPIHPPQTHGQVQWTAVLPIFMASGQYLSYSIAVYERHSLISVTIIQSHDQVFNPVVSSSPSLTSCHHRQLFSWWSHTKHRRRILWYVCLCSSGFLGCDWGWF